jgi:hypothetical protein
MVPLFLAALLVVRGVPALLYGRLLDRRETLVAGLLQATSLPFLVAATAIGGELDLIGAGEGAALSAPACSPSCCSRPRARAPAALTNPPDEGIRMQSHCHAYTNDAEAHAAVEQAARRRHAGRRSASSAAG